jgi:hypothetical protein
MTLAMALHGVEVIPDDGAIHDDAQAYPGWDGRRRATRPVETVEPPPLDPRHELGIRLCSRSGF